MNEITNWLEEEVKILETNKPSLEYPEALKLPEKKITEIVVDFSKPFEKKPNKLSPGKIQAIIPVTNAGVKKTFWLNVSNPLYAQICKAGKAGQTNFKILRTGTGNDSRYTIVE